MNHNQPIPDMCFSYRINTPEHEDAIQYLHTHYGLNHIGQEGKLYGIKDGVSYWGYTPWCPVSTSAEVIERLKKMKSEPTIQAYGLTTRYYDFKNGEYGCAECCNGDRCDEDCTAKYKGDRKNCPHCKGKGFIPESALDKSVSPLTAADQKVYTPIEDIFNSINMVIFKKGNNYSANENGLLISDLGHEYNFHKDYIKSHFILLSPEEGKVETAEQFYKNIVGETFFKLSGSNNNATIIKAMEEYSNQQLASLSEKLNSLLSECLPIIKAAKKLSESQKSSEEISELINKITQFLTSNPTPWKQPYSN